MNHRWIAGLVAMAALGGCASIGPRSVPVDRFDYNTAIAESWKEQTLLNIVKLRYMDLPVFVDVGSVVAGYSLQSGVTLGGGQISGSPGVNSVTGNIQGIYTDRPTITYMPMTGEKFLRSLVNPIDPRHIFFMIQSGYAADFLLGMTVESLNGVRNRSTLGGQVRPADPEFLRAMELLRELQRAGSVGMRVEEDKVKGSTAILFFQREELSPELQAVSVELRQLLHLPPDAGRFTLVYSPMRGTAEELTVNSRSMLQILMAFAGEVQVPPEDIASGAAAPGFTRDAPHQTGGVHSGTRRPDDAFTAVRYRDRWFWIPDSDPQAKRALTAVNFFFAMAGAASNEQMPLITIPAQ
jgi:hypothetical protein